MPLRLIKSCKSVSVVDEDDTLQKKKSVAVVILHQFSLTVVAQVRGCQNRQELPRIYNSLSFSLDPDPCSEEGRGVMAEKQEYSSPKTCRLILLSCGLIFMVREKCKCCTSIKIHL